MSYLTLLEVYILFATSFIFVTALWCAVLKGIALSPAFFGGRYDEEGAETAPYGFLDTWACGLHLTSLVGFHVWGFFHCRHRRARELKKLYHAGPAAVPQQNLQVLRASRTAAAGSAEGDGDEIYTSLDPAALVQESGHPRKARVQSLAYLEIAEPSASPLRGVAGTMKALF